MKKQQLGDKIDSLKAASNFEHKLIDSIYNIMQLKRKAEDDYKNSLEGINRELEKYVVAENGFLTAIVQSFQSYINVMHQNQKTLIEGYDNEILHFLKTAQQSKFEESIVEKVKFVDKKVSECKENMKKVKKYIKDNEEELELVSS